MQMALSIKPRHTPSFSHRDLDRTLHVLHPHYSSNHNTLLKLPALDEGDTVNYYVALIICGIIADNSWKTGWFARASDGSAVCQPGVPLAAADGAVFYFADNWDCKRRLIYRYTLLTSLFYR